MVSVTANLDLLTYEVYKTGNLVEDLYDLHDQPFGIIFVARDTEFYNEAWRNRRTGKTFMQVVLPYEEVLHTDNFDLLAYRRLYEELDKVTWLDKEAMKERVKSMIMRLESADPVA